MLVWLKERLDLLDLLGLSPPNQVSLNTMMLLAGLPLSMQ
jgi:hypothetical protein